MQVVATSRATVVDTSGPGRAPGSARGAGAAGLETGTGSSARSTRGATTYSRPAFVIRSVTFCASSVDGSTFGACSESRGGRAGLAGTPLATGYSKDVPF